MNRKQLAILLAAPMLSAVVLALRWSRLPERVVTHWDESGVANGWTDKGWEIVAVVVGFPLLLALFSFWSFRAMPRSLPGVTLGGPIAIGFTWAFTVFFSVGIVEQNPSWRWVAVGAVIGVTAGGLAYVLRSPESTEPHADFSPDPTGVWSGHARPSIAGFLGIGLPVVVCVFLSVMTGLWWLIVVGLVQAVVMTTFLSYDITIGPSAVVIRGRLGLPRSTIDRNRISSAETEDVNGRRWGWGWRYKKRSMGVITRSGPALKLSLTDGNAVFITVDDPKDAVSALQPVGVG